MLKIRLTRVGKKKQPIFRVVVAEKSMPVKGKFIDLLGFYNPRNKEYKIDKEKVKDWLEKGAQLSDTVAMLLRKEGIKLPPEYQTAKKYVRVKKKKKEKSEGEAPKTEAAKEETPKKEEQKEVPEGEEKQEVEEVKKEEIKKEETKEDSAKKEETKKEPTNNS